MNPIATQHNTWDPISAALTEDSATADISSSFFLPSDASFHAHILAREPCIIAGTQTAADTFRKVSPQVKVEILLPDASQAQSNQSVLRVEGPAAAILAAERVALNFLQHLSGIATLTAKFVEAIRGTNAILCDTRKTTPGLRQLEKAAVRAGGGYNHRISLADMVILKDNHLAILRSLYPDSWHQNLAKNIQNLLAQKPHIPIAVEADSLSTAQTLFSIPGISLVMLDNLSIEDIRRCVAIRPPGLLLEATGGISLDNVRLIAQTGVDRISVGTITHSAPAINFSLEPIESPPLPT
ncbi:MAG: carboxylating nicotinate-nucleotide diphosphorylase [Chthoniobacterales bacterium]|nr:carboxylating nicotinate-nucleotide diphosphorylase [Chthoniobacterales bacterium]MCX7713857.1 carboxylating nicotinate-nucleotide diphosphorylase [Chthoniobacterales bacterium]